MRTSFFMVIFCAVPRDPFDAIYVRFLGPSLKPVGPTVPRESRLPIVRIADHPDWIMEGLNGSQRAHSARKKEV
jgi:hypothetical protein